MTAELRKRYNGRIIDKDSTGRLRDVVAGKGASLSALSGHNHFAAGLTPCQSRRLGLVSAGCWLSACRRAPPPLTIVEATAGGIIPP